VADNGPTGTSVSIVIPPGGARPGTPGVTTPSPRPHLPFTGLDVVSIALLAVLLVALGSLLVIRGRATTHISRRT
jgi:hypothetical protein